MIGVRTPAALSCARIRRAASIPSITGIRTSISTASNRCSAAAATARLPSSTAITRCPAFTIIRSSSVRLTTSSSATNSVSGRPGASSNPVAFAAGAATAASGMANRNVLPTPGWLCTRSSPPISRTSSAAIANPSPVPP